MRSWESAYHFLQESFGITSFSSAQPTAITTVEVEYIDETDGKSLKGHLAMPSAGWKRPLPAVVIFPDWDGANTYEQERATALAELGYVAMVADIFGADKQFVEEVSERVELITQYLSDPDLYVSRMQAAVDQIKMLADDVNMDEIAVIGYCFGGTVSLCFVGTPSCLQSFTSHARRIDPTGNHRLQFRRGSRSQGRRCLPWKLRKRTPRCQCGSYCSLPACVSSTCLHALDLNLLPN